MASTEFLAGLAGGMKGLEEGLEDLRARIKEAKNKQEKKRLLAEYRQRLIDAGIDEKEAGSLAAGVALGRSPTTAGEVRKERQAHKKGELDIAGQFLKNTLSEKYGAREKELGVEGQETSIAATQTGMRGTEAGIRRTNVATETAEFDLEAKKQGRGQFGLPTDMEMFNNVWDKAHAYAEKRMSSHHKNWYAKYGSKRDGMDPLIGQLFDASGQPAKEALPNDVIPPEEPAWEEEYDKYIQDYLMTRYGVDNWKELGANVKRERPLKEGEGGGKGKGNPIREKFGRDTGFQFGPAAPGSAEEDGGGTATPPVVDEGLKQQIMEMLKDPDLANDPDVQRIAKELGLL